MSPPAADDTANLADPTIIPHSGARSRATEGPGPGQGSGAETVADLVDGPVDGTIDGTIDLHGQSREAAQRSLTRFIEARQAAGARCILVITGKGLNQGGQGDCQSSH